MLTERLAEGEEAQHPLDPTALAAEALRMVGVDAAAAEVVASQAIDSARAAGNRAAESTGWRARGLAARDRGDLAAAERSLRAAIACGRCAGGSAVSEARMTLAFILLEQGDTPAARRLARSAVAGLSGTEQVRARIQLALIQQRTGAIEQALQTYADALAQLRRNPDIVLEAKLRNNRGILLAYQGQTTAAERDLARAERLFDVQGHRVYSADARWNRGFAAGLRGDSVAALAHFEEAGSALDAAGVARSFRFVDQAQVLLSVGLVQVALELTESACAELRSRDAGSDLAEALLLHAEVLMANDNLGEAARTAREAEQLFVAQGRPNHALLAQLARLRATADDDEDEAWGTAERTAAGLAQAGWTIPAVELGLLATRRRLASGGRPSAEEVRQAAKAAASGSAGQRLRGWQAVALSRLAEGNTRGATRALLAGLRVHQAHRSTLAATELQVHVAARARELAETGLELALQSGRPSSIFDWAERWRAGSLLNRPVRPPKDALLAERLTQLRAVSADLEVARLSGDDVSKVRRQQLALERAIAARARLLAPELTQSSAVTSSQLQASLGDRALIEFIHLGDEIVAVVVDDARMTLHELGSARAVHDELQHMRFGIKRLAARDSGPLAAAAAASVRAAAATVDGCLLGPLSARLQGRPLVIVPTGAMHGLPWDLLPSLSLQPLTVAPSASVWRLARERSYVGGAVATVVAGPGLPGAAREVAAVAAVHGPRTRLFHGEAATAGAVLQALEGVFLAHLATHGHFRSDNPLFSALTVADGELTVYDLEGLETPPSIVVLSACDSGLSAVHPGDELMGLSAALLRMGTKTLVASIAPVPDDVAERTMASLHAGLAIGLAPATALAEARKELNESDRIRAASLVCFGAG